MRRIGALILAAVLVVFLAACTDKQAATQRYFESGNRYLGEEKYEEAIVEYRNALQQDERFGEARVKLGDAYAASGNARAALREYVRAADVLPDDPDVQNKAARFLLLAGQFEDAQTRVRRVLDENPRNVEAQVMYANTLAGLRDLDGAVAEIEEAIQLDPQRGQSYSNLALMRLAQGQREAAQAAFQKAVEIDPQSVVAWLALANFQWSSGDSTTAEQSLKRAIDLEPRNVLTNRALAALYVGSGRAQEAETHLKVIAETTKTSAAQLALADYYLTSDRSDDARRILEPLTKEPGTSAEAESRLAAMAHRAGRTAEAHTTLDRVIAREPANARALLLKSRWLFVEGKQQEALERANAAVKSDPRLPAAYYMLGTIQASLRQTTEAIVSFSEVLKLNPRASAAQVQLSRLNLMAGETERAVEFAQGALSSAPNSPEARTSLARGLLARRDVAGAEREITALMKQYPTVSVVHSLDGTLRLMKKDVTGARAAYEHALELNPQSIEALTGVTRIDLAQNRSAEARTRLNARLAAAPDHPGLLLLAANVHAAGKDLTRAEESLRRLIQVDPGNTTGYSMLASIYLAQRKLDAARTEFDQIVSRDPQNIAAQTMAAMIVHAQQNTVEAKKRYVQIVQANPRAAVAANNLAWIYAEEGSDLDEALRLAQSAAQELPDRPEVQDTLGWVYYRKELPSLAIPSFERSVEKAPENAIYHYHLALAHAKNGNVPQAMRAVEQALKLKPDYADAQRLLTSLQG